MEENKTQDLFDELLSKLNEAKILQYSSWDECIPEEIWSKHFQLSKWKIVDSELDIDKHRWYELSTQVVEIYGRYLGVRAITQMYSESSSISDIYHHLQFFEMKPVQTITYVKK